MSKDQRILSGDNRRLLSFLPLMATPPYLKRFGQHHLVDGKLCRPLVDFLAADGGRPEGGASPGADGPLHGRRVVEIGPGGGVLTGELLAAGARVLAVEVDLAWAAELAAREKAGRLAEGHGGRLAVTVNDALTFPWERLGREDIQSTERKEVTESEPGRALVAGNLPYNVATPLLREILLHPLAVARAAVLVQKEVADRLAAGPGDAAYGALSVWTAARAEVSYLGQVKPGSFRPPPKVAGGLVGLRLRPPPLPEEHMRFFEETVAYAFGQRRKRLSNSLGAGWGKKKARAALEAAGIDAGRRAEELGLEEFVALARAALQRGSA